jgi:excisionase family DNA binding protein
MIAAKNEPPKVDNAKERPPALRPLLVKPPEAARLLSISARKLWQMTNCGELPCVRIGAAVRYSPADLEAWVESQK